MEQEIKNEDVNEEIVNEEQETTAEEQVEAAETKESDKKELTPEEKLYGLLRLNSGIRELDLEAATVAELYKIHLI